MELLQKRKKLNLLTTLKEKFVKDEKKIKALNYLNEFGDKFWCETDERVKQIAETFESKVKMSGGLSLKHAEVGLDANGGTENNYSISEKKELANKYQRIVNEAQVPRLNEMVTILSDYILDSEQHFTYLIIDDLDKQWVEQDLSNTLVRCLLETVMELQKVKHLKVLIALRTNIFDQLGYEKKTAGQEEKMLSKVLHIEWTKKDLIRLMQARADAASKYYEIEPPKSLAEILPSESINNISPLDYILGKTLMKPRDAIIYFNFCIREAAGSEKMTWGDIQKVEIQYSSSRLNALRDEWKDPYLGIDKLLECFQNKELNLDRKALGKIFDEVALLVYNDKFPGTTWLTPLCEEIWELEDVPENWSERYRRLLELLFKISFIGIREDVKKPTVYFLSHVREENHLLGILKTATHFEVHFSFRPALGIK